MAARSLLKGVLGHGQLVPDNAIDEGHGTITGEAFFCESLLIASFSKKSGSLALNFYLLSSIFLRFLEGQAGRGFARTRSTVHGQRLH